MMGITLKVCFKKKKLQKSLLSSKNTTLTIGKVWYEEKIVPIRSYISRYRNSCMHLIYSTLTLVGES